MARKSRRSGFEGLIEVVALMPWWAGVVLAVIAYFLLHGIATRPVAISTVPGQMGASVASAAFHGLASFGQYVLPLVCLVGAAVSAWRRRERQHLLANTVKSDAANALDGMSWQQFEMLVGEAFRQQGYRVVETGGGAADGGIDLVLTKGNEKFLVQCKQWKAFKVGVDVVRELYGVMAAKGAAGGFVVTSGRFTADAVEFANGRNIKLLDGPALHGLLRQARAATAAAVNRMADRPAAAVASESSRGASVPTCPVCNGWMVRRVAQRGANAGGAFWGCTAYPACHGTRQIA